MADSAGSNPKIFKLIGIFIAAFFLLIIVFNIWMKASLDKTGVLSTSKAVSGKIENKKPSGTVTETVTAKQKTEQPENLPEDQPVGERQLILQ